MTVKRTSLILIVAAIRLVGADPVCEIKSGEKKIKLNTAQCYAHELAKLTSDYLAALEKQVSGQQDTYERLAALYFSALRTDTNLAVEVEQAGAVQKWILQLSENRVKVSAVLEDVVRRANNEFLTTRVLHEQDLDGKASYLGSLNSLETNTKKVAGLKDLLDELAQPTDLKKVLGDLAAFGQAAKTQIQLADCALAKSRLGYFNGESARLAAELAKTGLTPADKVAYTERKKGIDAQIKTLKEQAGKCAAQ